MGKDKREMSRKRMVNIEGQKIEEAMREIGISKRFVSRQLGHRDDYIQRAIREGRLPETELRMFSELTEREPADFYHQEEGEQLSLFDCCATDETEALNRLCEEVINSTSRLLTYLKGGIGSC